LVFAVLLSQAQWIEISFYPYAVLLQTVPILALVPLIGLLFGFGMWARILVCVIISLFPIITNTLFGLKSAEKSQHELFTLHHASRLTRLMKLQFPAALPAMFTGFQISAGLSVIGAIVGGFFFGRGPRDLGNRILLYSNRLRPAEMIAAVILSALLGVTFFQFFGWAGNLLTRSWYEAGR
ncbi:MAG: ABC transporter permease, partial [Acidimicrobiales bacterium]